MSKISLHHREHHRINRSGWLRAAVLGANDGIISTASLLIGVAAAQMSRESILASGLAGLVAGAMSMAAGEYVSVRSQADTEAADLEKERYELQRNTEHELDELTSIYIERGLQSTLAREVAVQLMAHDALGAHARDELGLSTTLSARPLQAALASAATFAVGAALPLLVATVVPAPALAVSVAFGSLLSLAGLGGVAAWAGGASIGKGVMRVAFWGAAAMGMTAAVGALFGTPVA